MSLLDDFLNAPRRYTLVPFWFLNDDLTEEELKRQIDDFEAHGVYGFVPHARIGLPESIGFMSEAWLRFTKVCVDYAAEKGMYVVLYDEGMYPSGSCAGQVVAENPRYATRSLLRRKKGAVRDDEVLVAEDDKWAFVNVPSRGVIRGVHYGWDDANPGAPPSGDLLNPEAMACFRRLVLDRHYDALKEHFGKTVIAMFTDEPDVLGRRHRGGVKPWTWGFEQYLEETLGYDFRPHLNALWDDKAVDADRCRRDFNRAVARRLEEVYYTPYGVWCADHGIALTGHPAGPDDIGVMKHFQMPAQDIVWRYIEPYKDNAIEGEQSTMAKCSVSAQRHYGRARNGNECFGAYGWEFTYDEMRYVTDWLLVRGVNLIMPHAFYYSVRDERRNERPPDVGPNNTWWDGYKQYADYCRRMSWLLAQGKQVCHFAILGTTTKLPWRAARVLFETQHDFNYLDTDTLRTQAKVDAAAVTVRDMAYKAVILDGADYTDPECVALLKPLIDAGRVIAYKDAIEGVDKVAKDAAALAGMLDAIVFPDVTITPANPHLRYQHMRFDDDEVFFFANEGKEPIQGKLNIGSYPPRAWWDPFTADVLEGAPLDRIDLPPLTTRLLIAG